MVKVSDLPQGCYLVAVSGGVDSVVLLDQMAQHGHEIIVAHVDHGIRPDSADDARFVRALAGRFHLPYVETQLRLGSRASEATARTARYEFLRREARKHHAKIVTAHHADDVIETIALNLVRGTGWRGLAVFGASDIVRPLLGLAKAELYDYALAHRLEWVEDASNRTDMYLRNRLRKKLASLDGSVKHKLLKLWTQQQTQKVAIYHEAKRFLSADEFSRYFFTMLPPSDAVELLRIILEGRGHLITRPHAERMLLMLKVGRVGTRWPIEAGIELVITKHGAVVEFPPRVV